MEKLKGLILSGGTGTRLRPITYTSAKQLVPVANKPVLFYGIEALAAAGIDEIGIIISPETGGEIREAAGDGERFGVSITYIEQEAPLGLAHAVLTGEPFLGDSPFVMYLGDNLLRDGVTELVEHIPQRGARCAHPAHARSTIPRTTASPSSTARSAWRGWSRSRRTRARTSRSWASTCSRSSIFDAARAIEPSGRGELEITDAIQYLVDDGQRVDPHIVHGWWKDTGQVQDMLEANHLILDDLEERIEGELVDSRVEGRVVIEKGARLERATVRGPAIIGEGAVLRDAYIGPYTAVGPGVRIESAEVEYSIVLEGSSIENLQGRIEASLVGKNVAIHRSPATPARIPLCGGRQRRDRDSLSVAGLTWARWGA